MGDLSMSDMYTNTCIISHEGPAAYTSLAHLGIKGVLEDLAQGLGVGL